MPHQTNRSSRRSDTCHLCSLQSWKVKKASTASQQSLHVNITYSSDEGVSEYTHHQATGDGLHSSSVQTWEEAETAEPYGPESPAPSHRQCVPGPGSEPRPHARTPCIGRAQLLLCAVL